MKRACGFVSLAGTTCPHVALPRLPYCHIHQAVHEAAGRVFGSFMSEALSWMLGGGIGGGRHEEPFRGLPPDVERLIREMFGSSEHSAAAPVRVPNHYKILGVPATATTAEIKAVYRKRIKDAHPDRGGDTVQAAKINDAYAVLGDPAKRTRYDALLRSALR